jgi:tyrosine-protein phosphatase SIW14
MRFVPAVLLCIAVAPAAAAQQATGVSNFHQVNERLYRGAQPNAEGIRSLAALGVKTVIDLRGEGGRAAGERKVVEGAGMRYVAFPLSSTSAPSETQISKLLALLNDASSGPVFVHCRRGADRTGTVIAIYRIAHDGWDNRKALDEAVADGMSWIEVGMRHFIMRYRAVPAAAN